MTDRFLKRAIDITGAVLGLVVLAPLMVVAALAVWFTSPGPIIFKQERVGLNGRRFETLKFRTMYAGADQLSHRMYIEELLQAHAHSESTAFHAAAGAGGGRGRVPLQPFVAGEIPSRAPKFKLHNDVRVTRVGRLLRSWSIDELPQLINVLRGEMSLVGPRPDLPYSVSLYEQWQHRRLEVKPGLTGLWQVSGRGELSVVDMLRLDVEYADRRSFFVDCHILLITIPAILKRTGAA